MAEIKLRNIRKNYGTVEVLHGVDLDIESGEFVVFVGPSGCGKSTLLRTIAGLEEISSGEFHLDGKLMNYVKPANRGISMVFQSYALYPHMSVFDNMAFGLKIAGVSKDQIQKRIEKAAASLHLTPFLQRHPKALSGGQRQRVAIGRAIVRNPKVFLFDEPLSNLDAALRVATRIEIAKLKQSMPDTTMIYVTHDQVEAMTLADRIVVLKDGKIEQVGTPIELYREPASLFVAQFIGSPAMNLIPARLTKAGNETEVCTKDGNTIRIPVSSGGELIDSSVMLGVRPEDVWLAEAGSGFLKGCISLIEQLGEVQLVYLEGTFFDQPLIAKLPGTTELEVGMEIELSVKPELLHVFDQNEARLKRADFTQHSEPAVYA
ncbi:ABC transporter ATP-binding protein [Celeribacter neptunius]|uniref:Maltose ABC transporter ATP-binding protein/trehalose ABC transporter ATP-binding protein/sucrose ABC transporter ATP-binding protein n=1 Tax=Celeribacter neptunius TaxID=588602 RepID=A0A1I3TX72_9RHOB|nr:sn-glycerol-3-phosphate ABC transporter ATP-binding protein UgpC [Celeribacter neptunius]SFJ74171.1 maltose ABC transporter ATP-binding protein/trehalose ABC transporter ATP-binding protein/sucrose ABC transporter ATP-binding protein [Celeribacter neptunius]